MNNNFTIILKKIGIFNQVKLIKDKYFENPLHTAYRESLLLFYSQFINKNDLCFDIGANYGNRTETFLKLGARVVTVEPQPNESRFLNIKFGQKINLVVKAIGAKKKIQTMYLNEDSAISSLSEEWIEKVSQTKRFKHIKWNNKLEVEVTTLDELIKEFGIPDFCKIDVEGYELEVLKGLSQSIKQLSFEFTVPEFTDKAVECVEILSNLGKIKCNFSPAETLKLGLTKWLDPTDFIPLFKTLPAQNISDGDIYVKFLDVT